MQKPSDKWKKLRSATLERARRNMIKPLEPIYLVLCGASALYLVGFIRLSLVDQPSEFNWLAGIFVVMVAVAGLLLTVLTGSVLTLHYADRRLGRLLGD